MKNNIKYSTIALAISQALILNAAIAEEQTTQEDSIETIEVRGFGASLGKALREKRFSNSVVEVISSDDIGVLPDVSITDSLVRLPGIAASRDRGNASRISIRGMGPRLNVATMNNREIVSAEPSRDVRYEQFPAELINSVEVYKSPVASKVEGGISGLVNMNFVKPLDVDQRKINLGASLIYNELEKDLPDTDGQGSRANFSIVDKLSDSFGYAFGLTYQDQPSLGRGVESWDYVADANRGDINGNGKLESNPWGAVALSKRGNNERTGGLLILDFKPSDSLRIQTDLFYSQFDIKERDDQFGAGGFGNYNDEDKWRFEGATTEPVFIDKADGSEQLVTASKANHGVHAAIPTWFQTNEMLSGGVNLEYTGDVWTTKLDMGYSEASIESVWVNITPVWTQSDYELGINTHNTDAAQVVLVSGDVVNPDNWALHDVQLTDEWREDENGNWYQVEGDVYAQMSGNEDRILTDEMFNINLDFSRDLDWGVLTKLLVGGRYTDRTKENDEVNTWFRQASGNFADIGMSYDIGGDYVTPGIYTFKDWDQVANQAFGGSSNPDASRSDKNILASWQLDETNTALYVQLDMAGELGDIPYTGNIGVRYAQTEVVSTGHQQEGGFWTQDENGEWYEVPLVTAPAQIEHDYSEILPSLNMLFNLTEDSQVRLGIARTLSRPPLLEMRTGFSLDPTTTPPSAGGGNPRLNPYIADQVDLGYEYYWGEKSAATINLFYKDLKTHIGLTDGEVVVGDETYAYSGSLNGQGGEIKGLELMFQHSFETLPAPFDGLGVFSNYSYIDSGVYEFKPTNNPYTLGGMSKHNANFTLWYSKHGIDARVSANYRSEYTGINSWKPQRVNLNAAETTLDATLGYNVTENLKVTLQGQNLTNAASVSYWDNDKERPALNVEWGRRFLIGFNYSM
ncbi:TonB-dependent receptor (plasmid) [Saccharobesus litoralis]|uniref:TonB-dependent receptor n=1 Tax=Saccharobesus litoralis TaxID=2172099 RepID=A0A2S0VY64_9ALTE|nr:TonB-dependent receptor [Saccharobesus litoralis]AWB69167.1 TonB-dependent receptor [Saccharobesus litoralis]